MSKNLEFLKTHPPSQISMDLLKLEVPCRPIDLLRKRMKSLIDVTNPTEQSEQKAEIEQLLYNVVARYYASIDRGLRQDIRPLAKVKV